MSEMRSSRSVTQDPLYVGLPTLLALGAGGTGGALLGGRYAGGVFDRASVPAMQAAAQIQQAAGDVQTYLKSTDRIMGSAADGIQAVDRNMGRLVDALQPVNKAMQRLGMNASIPLPSRADAAALAGSSEAVAAMRDRMAKFDQTLASAKQAVDAVSDPARVAAARSRSVRVGRLGGGLVGAGLLAAPVAAGAAYLHLRRNIEQMQGKTSEMLALENAGVGGAIGGAGALASVNRSFHGLSDSADSFLPNLRLHRIKSMPLRTLAGAGIVAGSAGVGAGLGALTPYPLLLGIT